MGVHFVEDVRAFVVCSARRRGGLQILRVIPTSSPPCFFHSSQTHPSFTMFAAHCSHTTTTIQSFFSSVAFFCLLCKGLPLSFSQCPNHLYLYHRQKSLSSQFPHHPSDYGEDVRGVAEPTCKALLNINGSCIAIILNVLIRNPKMSREKSKQNQE